MTAKKSTYHSVPSTSKTMPFSSGAPEPLVFRGSRGANRFGGLRVWLIARPRRWTELAPGFLQRRRVLLEITKFMRSPLSCVVDE